MECGTRLSILASSPLCCGICIHTGYHHKIKIFIYIYVRIYRTCTLHIQEQCTYTLPCKSSYGICLLTMSSWIITTYKHVQVSAEVPLACLAGLWLIIYPCVSSELPTCANVYYRHMLVVLQSICFIGAILVYKSFPSSLIFCSCCKIILIS